MCGIIAVHYSWGSVLQLLHPQNLRGIPPTILISVIVFPPTHFYFLIIPKNCSKRTPVSTLTNKPHFPSIIPPQLLNSSDSIINRSNKIKLLHSFPLGWFILGSTSSVLSMSHQDDSCYENPKINGSKRRQPNSRIYLTCANRMINLQFDESFWEDQALMLGRWSVCCLQEAGRFHGRNWVTGPLECDISVVTSSRKRRRGLCHQGSEVLVWEH